MTNGEVRSMSIRAAQHLQTFKLNSDDIIGFYVKNSENVAPILFAALLLGQPINAIDPLYIKRNETAITT